MTTEQMIETATKAATGNTGYSYNPDVLRQIITDGQIPEGAEVGQGGVWEDGGVTVYNNGARAARFTEADKPGITQNALMMYAVIASQQGYQTGTIV